MRGYLDIVPVAARGSTGLYVRRGSGRSTGSAFGGFSAQETGCGTRMASELTQRDTRSHRTPTDRRGPTGGSLRGLSSSRILTLEMTSTAPLSIV